MIECNRFFGKYTIKVNEFYQTSPYTNRMWRKAIKKLPREVKVKNVLVLGYGGGGFAMQDSRFRKIAREWYGRYHGKNVVLVTHGPPFGTTLDLLGSRHVGNYDYRKFIERIKPKLVIAGHLHETAGAVDKIGTTKVVNPGWEGMVIGLK